MRRFVFVSVVQIVCSIAVILSTATEAFDFELLARHPAANSILLKRPLDRLTKLMLKGLAREEYAGRNFVFSPVPVHLLLSMELSTLGKDGYMIRDAMGYSSLDDEDIRHVHLSYMKMRRELKYRLDPVNNVRRECDKCDGGKPPLAFDILTKFVTKNNATLDGKHKEWLETIFNASISDISDKNPSSKRKLLNEIAQWADYTGFDNPILVEKDLDGDFQRLLLAVTHFKSSWLDSFQSGTHKMEFINGGLPERGPQVEYIMNEDVVGSRLMRFAPLEENLEKSFSGEPSPMRSTKKASGSGYIKPKKYMSKDLWTKYAKWNFTVLKVNLKGDFNFVIFSPTHPVRYKPKIEDELIDKLMDKLSYHEYALSQILSELDNDDYLDMRVSYIGIPKFSFEYDLEFDALHGLPKGLTNAGKTKFRTGIEVTQEGVRGAGSGHHPEKRSAFEYAEQEGIIVNEPFMFLVRYKKDILLCGKVTKLDASSYKLQPQ